MRNTRVTTRSWNQNKVIRLVPVSAREACEEKINSFTCVLLDNKVGPQIFAGIARAMVFNLKTEVARLNSTL